MGVCDLCHEPVEDDHLLEHLRLLHPDDYEDGPERWPDGDIVVHDQTLEPKDFRRRRRGRR
jgi:hypothetical protein